jgi:hypothetical protein
MSQPCPICHCVDATSTQHPTKRACDIKCPVCGDFAISSTANIVVQGYADTDRWKLSAWVHQYASSVVTESDLQAAVAMRTPSLKQRAERTLVWLNNRYPAGKSFRADQLGKWEVYKNPPGRQVVFLGGSVVYSELVSVSWSRSIEEMQFMVTDVLCKELAYLATDDKSEYRVSPKGLLHLEGASNIASSVGFCAMWFSEDVKPLWDQVIGPAIQDSGYDPLRIDSKQHNGKIDDEIMASIRGAKFVVADFTGNRGGVYYEAGFAHGLDLPVIFMCREKDDLHFDIRQYNCIFWKPDNLDNARERLKNRILATLGKGPLQVR